MTLAVIGLVTPTWSQDDPTAQALRKLDGRVVVLGAVWKEPLEAMLATPPDASAVAAWLTKALAP